RPREAAEKRNPGHRPGPRRRDHRRPAARGRAQPVQTRGHHHHFGYRRALSAAGADRARREARRRWRGRSSTGGPRDDQFRDRRAAVRAGGGSRQRAGHAGASLMVRAALTPSRRIGQAPWRYAGYVPAATVVAATFLSALPIISTSGWYPDFGYLVFIGW